MTLSVTKEYQGLLIIGDPHLEGRQPGFRKDDYPTVILDKLDWALGYARRHDLLPAILGDLFDKPRDNPNWMLVRLMKILQGEVLTIYGNHDVHYQPELTEHDSLSLLIDAGRLTLVSSEQPWNGLINGHPVTVGGSSYRQDIPKTFERPLYDVAASGEPTASLSHKVIWLTHHDVLIPGYDEGRIAPYAIPGIDMVINGHIHRRLESIHTESTIWVNPGNISRRSRSDATRQHVPSVLRIGVEDGDLVSESVEVPHASFDDVFHDVVYESPESLGSSAFVAGLSELQTRRTSSGEGLREFLKHNLDQFSEPVVAEIWQLADEVTEELE